METEKRIRELVRHNGNFARAYAFWIDKEHFATKRGKRISVYRSRVSSSHPKHSRLVFECRKEGAAAYVEIAEAMDAAA